MRDNIKSGDFATYAEKMVSKSSELGETATSLPSSSRNSSSAAGRLGGACLGLLAVATFYGVGVLILLNGVSTGHHRFSGKEFVLTGPHATLSGLIAMACAVPFTVMLVRQLPKRMRLIVALTLLAVSSLVPLVLLSK